MITAHRYDTVEVAERKRAYVTQELTWVYRSIIISLSSIHKEGRLKSVFFSSPTALEYPPLCTPKLIMLGAFLPPTLTDTSTLQGGLALTGLLVVGYVLSMLTSKRLAPLPPGPRGLPVIGNLLMLPDPAKAKRWEAYKQLSSQYGKFLQLKRGSRTYSLHMALQ